MAPIVHRTRAPRRARAGALAACVALLAGLVVLAAPASPASALTLVQSGVKPPDSECQSGRLHTGGTIGTCGGITITKRLRVNGADVPAGTPLAVGDVVTVSVVVTPQGGGDAMYAETVDGIRNNQYDTDGVISIGLPSQTGTLLSAPTGVTMSRTDNGDRGNGPAINCLAQAGQDAARTDPDTAIALGAGPVGLNGMRAAVSGTTLTAKWTTMAVDRCVGVVSNNGFYPGHSISFTQTVLARGVGAQTPTWSLGGLTLQLDDGSRALSWGSAENASLPLPAATTPSAPTIGSATAGNAQATVSWTAPPADGGSPVTGYVVTPYVGATAQAPRTFASTATTQVVTGLTNGTAYTFRVAATNAVGTGAQSAASATVTPTAPATAPGAPTIGTATAGHGEATVRWTAPASDGGSPITGYTITPSIGATAQPTRSAPAGATSLVVTGLTNGTTYTFRVAATNVVGTGAQSAASNAVTPTPAPTVPGAPTIGAVTPGNGEVTVSWTAPASDGGSAITGYVVTPFVDGIPQAPVPFAGVATTRTVTGLVNGLTYRFRVAATNTVGTGPTSEPSAFVFPRSPWFPFASADAFTRRQHLDLAGREPTAEELDAWEAALVGGTASAAELVESLRTAAYWDGTLAPIVRLYRAVYLRNPDTAGLAYWEAEYRSGRKTLNQIANFFAVSPEFRTLYGTLSNPAFVTEVYELVLERPPSAADLAYWVGELERGQPHGKLVLLFSGSAEYRAEVADRVAVILIRFGMLEQVGPNAAVDAALSAIAGGATYEDIVAALLLSPEYGTRLAGL